MCTSLLFCVSLSMLLSGLDAIEVKKLYDNDENVALNRNETAHLMQINNYLITQRATTVLTTNIFEEKRDQLGLLRRPETLNRLLLEVQETAREIILEQTMPDHTEKDKNEPEHKNEDYSVAANLAKKVKVLCMVLTHPKNHLKKAVHVKATWGKRCNRLLFMSTEEDKLLPTVKLNVKEGHKYLWLKVRAAFKYVYKYHRNEADWFLKADDDTYVVMENLRYFLLHYKSTNPYHFGHRLREATKQSYIAGGAGYVLSRSALERLVKKGLPSSELCPAVNMEEEDVEISLCLKNIGVAAIDPRDLYKKGRFFVYTADKYLLMGKKNRDSCCSDHTISFHYVSPDDLYTYEYFLYHFRRYGISQRRRRGGV